jgi:hypothetical protein
MVKPGYVLIVGYVDDEIQFEELVLEQFAEAVVEEQYGLGCDYVDVIGETD